MNFQTWSAGTVWQNAPEFALNQPQYFNSQFRSIFERKFVRLSIDFPLLSAFSEFFHLIQTWSIHQLGHRLEPLLHPQIQIFFFPKHGPKLPSCTARLPRQSTQHKKKDRNCDWQPWHCDLHQKKKNNIGENLSNSARVLFKISLIERDRSDAVRLGSFVRSFVQPWRDPPERPHQATAPLFHDWNIGENGWRETTTHQWYNPPIWYRICCGDNSAVTRVVFCCRVDIEDFTTPHTVLCCDVMWGLWSWWIVV